MRWGGSAGPAGRLVFLVGANGFTTARGGFAVLAASGAGDEAVLGAMGRSVMNFGRRSGAAGGGGGGCGDTVFVEPPVLASAFDTFANGRLPAKALDTRGSAAVRDTVDVTTLASEVVGDDGTGAEATLLSAMGTVWKVGEDGGLRSVSVIFWKLSTKIPATWE